MAWAFQRATRRGVVLEIVIEDAAEGEVEVLTYTYPARAGQTAAQFKAMVKREVRALLDERNAATAPEDVTSEYASL